MPYSTKNHLNFLFIIYNPISKEVHCTFFKLSLFLAVSLDNEHESMLKGNQIKSSQFSSNSGVIK